MRSASRPISSGENSLNRETPARKARVSAGAGSTGARRARERRRQRRARLDDGEAERGQLLVGWPHAAVRLPALGVESRGGATTRLQAAVQDHLHVLEVRADPPEPFVDLGPRPLDDEEEVIHGRPSSPRPG
jgi:hypothetical protein